MFDKNNQIKLKDSQNFLNSKKLVTELIEESNICKDDCYNYSFTYIY